MKNEKDCACFQGLIVQQANEPLNAGQKKELDEHLSGCAECRQYQSSLGESLAFFKHVEAPQTDIPAPAISTRGPSIVQGMKAIFDYRVPLYKIAAVIAIFVFLLVGWLMFRGSSAGSLGKNGISSISYTQDKFCRENNEVYASSGGLF